jgi:hypothetical protein
MMYTDEMSQYGMLFLPSFVKFRTGNIEVSPKKFERL